MEESARGIAFNIGGLYVFLGTILHGPWPVMGYACGLLGGMMMSHAMYEWMYWRDEWARLNAAFARATSAKAQR